MPHERIENVNEDLKEFIMKAASTDPWLRDHPPKVEFIGLAYEGAIVDPSHPIVGALGQGYSQVMDAKAKVAADHSGNDMRLYTNHGDTPSVVFGPGSGRTAHFPDEHVPLDQYIDAIKILAATAVEWCGHES